MDLAWTVTNGGQLLPYQPDAAGALARPATAIFLRVRRNKYSYVDQPLPRPVLVPSRAGSVRAGSRHPTLMWQLPK